MAQELKTLAIFPMVLGNTMNIHQEFLKRLRQRLQLTQAYAGVNCDVIIAFVPVVSRVGTDIESALQKIPRTGKPVVLVVLHITFDENYVAPQSKRYINRNDVFAVDVLCYEDLGLLRCLRNDEALKAVTDYLISIGGSPNTQQFETTSSQRQCNPLPFIILISLIFFIGIVIVIGFIIYVKKWPKHNVTALQPNTTINNTFD